jgi:hypothetical protein
VVPTVVAVSTARACDRALDEADQDPVELSNVSTVLERLMANGKATETEEKKQDTYGDWPPAK